MTVRTHCSTACATSSTPCPPAVGSRTFAYAVSAATAPQRLPSGWKSCSAKPWGASAAIRPTATCCRSNSSITCLKDLPTLIEHLGEELPGYSELHLDRSALEGEDLALILPVGRPQCIQVFYRLNEGSATAELSVLDEHNALWCQQMPFRDEQSLLTPLQRFLQSVLYRRNALLPLDNLPAHQPLEVLYYQVLPDAPLRAQRLERRPPPLSPISHPFYDVQAIVEPGDGKRSHVTLYCNHR